MRVKAKGSLFITIICLIVLYWIIVWSSNHILEWYYGNWSTLEKICLIILNIFIVLIIFRNIMVAALAYNYRVTLNDKHIIYKSLFLHIKEDYTNIKQMKVINLYLKLITIEILRIRFNGYKTIYLALGNSDGKARDNRQLKKKLIQKSGKTIIEKRR